MLVVRVCVIVVETCRGCRYDQGRGV